MAVWNRHDAPALAAMHAPDGVVASPTGGALEGREEIQRVYQIWFNAFPDIKATETSVLVDGDRAVQIVTFAGTHAGEFFGLPATRRHVEVTIAAVLTFAGGFITEERRIYDFTGVLVQVGVLKAKPGA